MATAAEDHLRFVRSGVDGLPAVAEVAVFPGRLELLSHRECKRIVAELMLDRQMLQDIAKKKW